MSNWKDRANNFFVGFFTGVIFPGIVYVFYWLFTNHQLSFPVRFTHYLINGYMLSNVIKICGLGNLLLFYLGLNQELDRFNKGIVTSIVVYIGLVAYVTYYLEPTYL